jgi:hypothetical protein
MLNFTTACPPANIISTTRNLLPRNLIPRLLSQGGIGEDLRRACYARKLNIITGTTAVLVLLCSPIMHTAGQRSKTSVYETICPSILMDCQWESIKIHYTMTCPYQR